MKKYQDLIKALDHFARPNLQFSVNPPAENATVTQKCGFVSCDEEGNKTLWSVEAACKKASDILREENLYRYKFEALIDGMKKAQIPDLYEFLMKEPCP